MKVPQLDSWPHQHDQSYPKASDNSVLLPPTLHLSSYGSAYFHLLSTFKSLCVFLLTGWNDTLGKHESIDFTTSSSQMVCRKTPPEVLTEVHLLLSLPILEEWHSLHSSSVSHSMQKLPTMNNGKWCIYFFHLGTSTFLVLLHAMPQVLLCVLIKPHSHASSEMLNYCSFIHLCM